MLCLLLEVLGGFLRKPVKYRCFAFENAFVIRFYSLAY